MRDRLRGMLGLDAVVPVVLIAAAVLMTLEPTVFGVAITERDIILGFFGFLGVDALVERTGRLSRIEKRLEALAGKVTMPMASEVLRARSSFDRMDVLVAQARHSVLIVGVNLEGALPCVSTLVDLARTGERAEFQARLDETARSRVSLVVTDRVLPVGVVGLDERARGGSLIVQHYLTATAAELAPLIWLRSETDQPWFGRYLAQCEACLVGARAWGGAND